jgi:phosphinothricin acetyltransferase
MGLAISIVPLTADHWSAVRAIYEEGISTGHATFAKSAPEWEQWDAQHLPSCRSVAISESGVVGFAALSSVSTRAVYAGVAEVSVYVEHRARGQGVGLVLLTALVAESEGAGIWTLQAGIFPENIASIELHKRAGFRLAGTRERLGRMDGRWRDVLLMERRSATVGIS